jgi:hypothetical protein
LAFVKTVRLAGAATTLRCHKAQYTSHRLEKQQVTLGGDFRAVEAAVAQPGPTFAQQHGG